MNYLVIDLEMCKVPKDYRNKNYKYASEIIQIGAVLLDERYRRRDEICLYVHPEHGVIDNFIANMTGIKNRQILLSTTWIRITHATTPKVWLP